MRSTDRPTYSVRFSWSCLAETLSAVSYTAEVYEPANSNRNAAYSQQSLLVQEKRPGYAKITAPTTFRSDSLHKAQSGENHRYKTLAALRARVLPRNLATSNQR
jgi:hypothetical protein